MFLKLAQMYPGNVNGPGPVPGGLLVSMWGMLQTVAKRVPRGDLGERTCAQSGHVSAPWGACTITHMYKAASMSMPYVYACGYACM